MKCNFFGLKGRMGVEGGREEMGRLTNNDGKFFEALKYLLVDTGILEKTQQLKNWVRRNLENLRQKRKFCDRIWRRQNTKRNRSSLRCNWPPRTKILRFNNTRIFFWKADTFTAGSGIRTQTELKSLSMNWKAGQEQFCSVAECQPFALCFNVS